MSSQAISPGDHLSYIRLALSMAKQSPPKPTNYCVGAVLVDEATNTVLSTGYTLELEGNTHAEQCALQKYAESKGMAEIELAGRWPTCAVIYTTMEPCSERLSGNTPCVDRILATRMNGNGGIKKVYVGVQEPEKFVGSNAGKSKLEGQGIQYIHVAGLETEILEVATAGHEAVTGVS